MYEIWSLGHKPFEESDGKEVVHKFVVYVILCDNVHTVLSKDHYWIQTSTTSWLS